MAADQRSVHPNFPGVPWWGAVLIAFTAMAVGFAFDAGSGNRELSTVFAVCYVAGCILAVLAVRQSGVFTAVIQPPLLLFGFVPSAYFLFHGGSVGGLKDVAINCGYPLIERFPLMFFTSAAVLLVGMARWYYGMAHGVAKDGSKTKAGSAKGVGAQPAVVAKVSGLVSAVATKVSGLSARKPAADGADVDSAGSTRRMRTSGERPRSRPRRTSRAGTAAASADAGTATGPNRTPTGPNRVPRKPSKRAAPSRARHNRPPDPDLIEPPVERPRRPRPRRADPDAVPPPPEPRRRPRPSGVREPRKTPPGDRRTPVDRRAAGERPVRRRRSFDDYQPFEPRDTPSGPVPRPRRADARGSATHHPVSRVRYRGTDNGDEGDHGVRYRTRPRSRAAQSWDAESWEYDA